MHADNDFETDARSQSQSQQLSSSGKFSPVTPAPQEKKKPARPSREEFAAKLRGLEDEAARNPGGYRRKLVLFALLGYFYIGLMIVALIAIFVLTIALLACLHLLLLLKLAFLPLIAIFMIAKSLFVKHKHPEGLALKRSDAPELFRLIDELRVKTKSPRIHTVLLNNEFNLAITQIPRVGSMAYYKNYLILGMPLMRCLSLPQFKAGLAHEMGHLSGLHGKFGSWIYQVRGSWQQIYDSLAQHSDLGSGLFVRFARWYFPIFDLRTLMLLRAHELAADRISGEAVGRNHAVDALVNVSVMGSFFELEFWPAQLRKVKDLPQPPKHIYKLLTHSLANPLDGAKVDKYIEQACDEKHLYESHPALDQRVRELSPGSERQLVEIYHQTRLVEGEPSAADQLMGKSLANLEYAVEETWRKQALPAWQQEHAFIVNARTNIAELEEKAEKEPLSLEDEKEYALYMLKAQELDRAEVLFRRLVELDPLDADVNYHLGAILLFKDDDQGIEFLEQAATGNSAASYEACASLFVYYANKDLDDEAQKYMERANELLRHMVAKMTAVSPLTREDKFVPHELSEAKVQRVCEILYGDPRIKQAYIVNQVAQSGVGRDMPVLVLRLGSAGLLPLRQEDRRQVAINLSGKPELQEFHVIDWELIKTNLATACRNCTDSFIYDREQFSKTEAAAHVVPDLPTESMPAAALTFFRRYKANFIALGIIVFFLSLGIVSVVNSPPVERSRYRGSEAGSYTDAYPAPQPDPSSQANSDANVSGGVDFRPYMANLEQRVKAQWNPPAQPRSNSVVVELTIETGGRLMKAHIVKSSGVRALDVAALKAVVKAGPFGVLPAGAPPSVTAHMTLDYVKHN